jgi:hypothetical protein
MRMNRPRFSQNKNLVPRSSGLSGDAGGSGAEIQQAREHAGRAASDRAFTLTKISQSLRNICAPQIAS